MEMSDSLLENATHAVLDNSVLEKIPIVGGIVAVGRGALDFRDRQFVSKLLRVLAETSNVSAIKREEFKEKLDYDIKLANKSGAILLDLIDKATGSERQR